MTEFQLEVRVTPRPGLLDPEGNAIHHALQSLGYDDVLDVRVGKAIMLVLSAESEEAAQEAAAAMSQKLLANPVTEDFVVELIGTAEGRS